MSRVLAAAFAATTLVAAILPSAVSAASLTQTFKYVRIVTDNYQPQATAAGWCAGNGFAGLAAFQVGRVYNQVGGGTTVIYSSLSCRVSVVRAPLSGGGLLSGL